ncbi:MAG: hypothetical protein HC905_11145 [Bacteroidales bacterium]|nr:hypothetical protein [Bacteroidales bacterium]
MYRFTFVFFSIILHLSASGNCFVSEDKKEEVLMSERVYLNTDRKVYIAGENLYFSFYLIDNKVKALVSYSSIGYVYIKDVKAEVIGRSQIKVLQGKGSGAIYLSDTLKTGYYEIVGYTNFMRNGSPEVFFKSQILVANRFDKDFSGLLFANTISDTAVVKEPLNPSEKSQPIYLQPVKPVFGKRERVGIKLNLKDTDIKSASLTISVVEKNSAEANQMLNQKKIARNSKGIIVNTSAGNINPIYLAEDKYAELLGQVTDENNYGLAYHVLYLTSSDTTTNFKYAVSDSKGYFRFPLSDFYSGKELFIKMKQNEGESITPKITVNSKYNYREGFTPQGWSIDSSLINYLRNSQDIVRILKSYAHIQSIHRPKKFLTVAPLLFKVPDFKVIPSEYTELKDFHEISREIIPALKIRKHNQSYEAEILDIKNGRYMQPKPLVFLDGVMIDDISQVVSFGSRDIKKIELISSEWMADHQKFQGVLSIFSNNNLWRNVILNSNNVRLRHEAFFEVPPLYSPDYSVTDVKGRDPDFRQVLYWNPDLEIVSGKTFEIDFFTSDYAGNYLIKVSGVTDKGDIIEAYSEIVVNE